MKTDRHPVPRLPLTAEQEEHVAALLDGLHLSDVSRYLARYALYYGLTARSAQAAPGEAWRRADKLRAVERRLARSEPALARAARRLRSAYELLASAPRTGRPASPWRRVVVRDLRALGVTRARAEELLEAAALAEPKKTSNR